MTYNRGINNQLPKRGAIHTSIMQKYTGFGKFEFSEVFTSTTAQHVENVSDLPTRRRRLNSLNRQLEESDYVITTIARQLDSGEFWANYLGDKYSVYDLQELMKDYGAICKAITIVKLAPCPAKEAKAQAEAEEAAKALELAEAIQREEANDAPQEITLTLPAGFDAVDLFNMILNEKSHILKLYKQATEQGEEYNAYFQGQKVKHLHDLSKQAHQLINPNK